MQMKLTFVSWVKLNFFAEMKRLNCFFKFMMFSPFFPVFRSYKCPRILATFPFLGLQKILSRELSTHSILELQYNMQGNPSNLHSITLFREFSYIQKTVDRNSLFFFCLVFEIVLCVLCLSSKISQGSSDSGTKGVPRSPFTWAKTY